MPQRTRSHLLEDISINEFKRLLPAEWVCREKDKDYGVDLEVEIFDPDGKSTGLLFYVQLKATDNEDIERSVSMKIDRLNYLASLDAPSVLVRYCDPTHATYFMWIGNVFAQIDPGPEASKTVNFTKSDAWDDATPAKVLKTLKVMRAIKAETRGLPLGLTVDDEGKSGSHIFELKLAVAKLQRMSKMINSHKDPEKCLPIEIRIRDDAFIASIDVVASITWRTDSFSSDDILPLLAYALAFMTGRYEFHRQASELIRIIHDNKFSTNNREFGSRVAQLAIADPDAAADIARWNRIHATQDYAYLSYIDSLLSSEIPIEKREVAITTFYTDAINDHDSPDDQRLSAVYYSLANFQMHNGKLGKAVSNYNKARKLSPSYLERTYFLAELGACCFWSRHLKMAALLYKKSYNLLPDSKVGICAGDAFLYSGDFTSATSMFEAAAELAPDEMSKFESLIKVWLSSWLNSFYHGNNLKDFSLLNNRAFWFDVIDQAIEAQEYGHALGAALVEAFLQDNDTNLWADAMNFAFNTGDERLILGTFSCAIMRNGYDVYALFRKILEERGIDSEGISQFDQIANMLYAARPSNDRYSVTKRVVGESHYDSFQEIPCR